VMRTGEGMPASTGLPVTMESQLREPGA
jgi:hypothetical protein